MSKERFAQVAHDKWANERFAKFVLTKIEFCSTFVYAKKRKKKLIPSFLMSDVSESLRSLTKNERC